MAQPCNDQTLLRLAAVHLMYCLCQVFQHLDHIGRKHEEQYVLLQVSSPLELEQCDEETLADILGTEARVTFPLVPCIGNA